MTVGFDLSTERTTAQRGVDFDFRVTDLELEIASGASFGSFSVDITDDDIDESNEVITFTLSEGDGYRVDDPSSHQLVIDDDDGAPSVDDEVNEIIARRPVVFIKRIVPSVREVTLSSGDRVVLSVDIFGRQDIQDQNLKERVSFDGSSTDGKISDNKGDSVLYTAPSSPGTYKVTALLSGAECESETECSAEFSVRVRRSLSIDVVRVVPENPPGVIPSILADDEGSQYEVFTPEEGGRFKEGSVSLAAGVGAVPNGEIVGLRIDDTGAASNVGMTGQRYTLAGTQ